MNQSHLGNRELWTKRLTWRKSKRRIKAGGVDRMMMRGSRGKDEHVSSREADTAATVLLLDFHREKFYREAAIQ